MKLHERANRIWEYLASENPRVSGYEISLLSEIIEQHVEIGDDQQIGTVTRIEGRLGLDHD
jgi:hypothetical protein